MRVWIASLLFYLSVFAFCEFLRYLNQKFLAPRYPYPSELVNEFIGTIQICAPMFDVNFILENYGLKGVLFEIIFIEVMNATLQRDAIADPCPLIYGFIQGTVTLRRLASLLTVQFIAGYTSYLIARAFWSFGIHAIHLEALEGECGADLTVTVIYGSLVEAGGLITAKAAEVFLEQRILNEKQLSFIQAVVAGVITVLGIHLTGMYANPIVAWACTFNCGDVPYLAHFTVYWVAPVLAWHIADQYLKTPQEVPEKED
uniref:Aquaporin n=1 Tax=Panagrellus redivivus TaxID=6233 RepID=A0A7E4W0H1_PANRE